MRRILLPALVLSSFAACDAGGEATAEQAAPRAAIQRVLIVDRGMNMPLGRLKVPPGWRVHQDIVTDTQTATYSRYLLDVSGPEGLIRGLGLVTYNRMNGQDLESVVEAVVLAGLQGFSEPEFGDVAPNQRRMQQAAFQKGMQQARAEGMQLEALLAPFRTTTDGKPVEGRVEVDHTIFINNGQHTGGMASIGLLLAQPGGLDGLTRVAEAIGAGFESNPAYDPARAQIMGAAHRQRMARNQAQFESHQQMMKGRYQSAYKQNQQWMQNFRQSGGSPQAETYGSHEKFLDSIRETTSFDDPNTGRTQQDGQFDRWATDGQGNYIGSDDPSFDPNAIEGDWKETKPLD